MEPQRLSLLVHRPISQVSLLPLSEKVPEGRMRGEPEAPCVRLLSASSHAR